MALIKALDASLARGNITQSDVSTDSCKLHTRSISVWERWLDCLFSLRRGVEMRRPDIIYVRIFIHNSSRQNGVLLIHHFLKCYYGLLFLSVKFLGIKWKVSPRWFRGTLNRRCFLVTDRGNRTFQNRIMITSRVVPGVWTVNSIVPKENWYLSSG